MCCCTCSHMLRGVPYAATEPCGSDSPNLTSIAGGGGGEGHLQPMWHAEGWDTLGHTHER